MFFAIMLLLVSGYGVYYGKKHYKKGLDSVVNRVYRKIYRVSLFMLCLSILLIILR